MYEEVGIYEIRLTIADSAGRTSVARTKVEVTEPIVKPARKPVARLTVKPTRGLVELTVTADATGSTGRDGAKIKKYRFTFGDGSKPRIGAQESVKHTYRKIGDFTLKVRVTDSNGGHDTDSVTVHVRAKIIKPPAKTAVKLQVVQIGTGPNGDPIWEARATASTADGTTIKNYSFDWGDRTQPSTKTVPQDTHTYEKPDQYTVRVTVTDSRGDIATGHDTADARSKPTPPSAVLDVDPRKPRVDEPVTLSARGSTGTSPLHYTFQSDEISCKQSEIPTCPGTFRKPGLHKVTLTVIDANGLESPATTVDVFVQSESPPTGPE